jgi:hypothetical protein
MICCTLALITELACADALAVPALPAVGSFATAPPVDVAAPRTPLTGGGGVTLRTMVLNSGYCRQFNPMA